MTDPVVDHPAVSADPPVLPASTSEERLGAARHRRRELSATLVEVERALAAPAPGRVEAWAARVRVGLDRLRTDLRRHVELTEGDGGLYRDVLSTAPRLTSAVARLEREHADLRRALDDAAEALEWLGAGATGTGPHDDERAVATARDRVTSMLGRFSRHRQRGADLVYEAYSTDIGGTG
jgi:hypothetical protein